MFKFIICLVIYGVVLLLRVVSLMAGSTNCLPMSPGYGRYHPTTLPSYYTKTTYATTGCCTTKAPEFTPELVMPQATTPTPRATLPKSLSTTPRRSSTTPLRHWNTTRLRMLPLPTTPRPLIGLLQHWRAQVLHYNLRCPEILPCVKGVVKKSCLKGERKGGWNQSCEDLRHGNNCSTMSPTTFLICNQFAITGKYSVFIWVSYQFHVFFLIC
jgi:hypothetical protein